MRKAFNSIGMVAADDRSGVSGVFGRRGAALFNMLRDVMRNIMPDMMRARLALSQKHTGIVFVVLVALCLIGVHVGVKTSRKNLAFASYDHGSAQGEIAAQKSNKYRHSLTAQVLKKPDYLLRLQGREVQKIFADPELVYGDLPTTIWQYRNPICTLDMFFTVNHRDAAYEAQITHYEMRMRKTDADPITMQSCLRQIIDAG